MTRTVQCRYCKKYFSYTPKSSQSFRRFCTPCIAKRREMYPAIIKMNAEVHIKEELGLNQGFAYDEPSFLI